MRKTKDELITAVRGLIGEDPSDEGVALLEDIADSMEDVDVSEYENKIATLEAEKAQIESDWKNKYISRFGAGDGASNDVTPENDDTDDEDVVDSFTDDEIAEMFNN